MLFNVLAAGVGAIAILRWLRHLLPAVESHAQTANTRQRWIRSAIPLALSEGMRVVSGNLPILVLGLLAPAHEVAVSSGSRHIHGGNTTLCTPKCGLLADVGYALFREEK